MNKRRHIPHFSDAELEARQQYECEQCGAPIPAGGLYQRDVFTVAGRKLATRKRRFPDRIEVERRHCAPDCAP